VRRRASLRVKLFAGFSLVLALMAGSVVVALDRFGQVADDSGSMYGDRVVPMRDLAEARGLLGDIDSQVLRSFAAQRPDPSFARIAQDDRVGIDRLIRAYAATYLVPEEVAGLRRFRDRWAAYVEVVPRIQALGGQERRAEASELYFRAGAPLYAEVDGALRELIAINTKVAGQLNASIEGQARDGRRLLVVVGLLALVVGLGVASWLSGRIRRGVAEVLDRLQSLRDEDAADLTRGLERLAEGDLTYAATSSTTPIARWSADEIGDMAQATNAIRERLAASIAAHDRSRQQLGELVGDVVGAAATVSSSSRQMAGSSEETGRAIGEIAHAVGDVAGGAERQVAAVGNVRSAAERVGRLTDESVRDAQDTARAAERARELAGAGAQAVTQATDAMAAVRDASSAATAAIRDLGAKSDEIGGIVDTITSIAAQTNLLALNAAIEAARAGDHGRGFALVADEVRQLAEEAQAAAASIAGLVREIQAGTGRAIEAVEAGGARTGEGAETVREAREAFSAIGSSVDDVGDRVGRIAAAVQEVAASAAAMREDLAEVAAVAEQSSASTEQVSAATQQTSASAQEISAAAAGLAGTATELEALVGRFRVEAA
jgi:methyl-accepting chemotaxis protein